MSLHVETPLVESAALSREGRSVWLKLEALQPPGSFKIRGIGHACCEYLRRGARRLVSSSGGNAGIAVAYAGRRLALPVTVVVPVTTTERAKALIRQEEAELIVHGSSWQEANAYAQSLLDASTAFLHPFDDPLVWQGHATLIDEAARVGPKPDAVVVSVGGGGLLCGVIEGLRRNDWCDVRVVAAETEGADSLALALRSGARASLDRITSIATSLGAKQVCEKAYEYSLDGSIRSAVVSDRAAVSACLKFLDDHRLLVEPACGAALALAYDDAPVLEGLKTILLVVCGGATASFEQLRLWSAALG